MHKTRLDLLLVERGLAADQHLAQSLVMAGQVRIEGQVVLQPAKAVPLDAQVSVDEGPPYVSRGGEKLAAALQAFDLSPAGLVCADVGASTGGFTDCLLQAGAAKVYAIDVGKGILDWKLRVNPRRDGGTNARSLTACPSGGQSPRRLIHSSRFCCPIGCRLPVGRLSLIKPQFEAGRQKSPVAA
jgi:23S rRNA (cytidine1920-2'-O)/16S rRNA (cytidine1409-2'-O)-methyltransferase